MSVPLFQSVAYGGDRGRFASLRIFGFERPAIPASRQKRSAEAIHHLVEGGGLPTANCQENAGVGQPIARGQDHERPGGAAEPRQVFSCARFPLEKPSMGFAPHAGVPTNLADHGKAEVFNGRRPPPRAVDYASFRSLHAAAPTSVAGVASRNGYDRAGAFRD